MHLLNGRLTFFLYWIHLGFKFSVETLALNTECKVNIVLGFHDQMMLKTG